MVTACYVDSSVLLLALTPSESKHEASARALEGLKRRGEGLITSTYAFVEVVRGM